MKSLLFVFLILSPAYVFAKDLNFTPCSLGCSPEQTRIVENYSAGLSPSGVESGPRLYSGACYHTAYHGNHLVYDPSQAHYAIILFDFNPKYPDSFYLNGIFGFFVKPDAYSNMTIKDMRARQETKYDIKHQVFIDDLSGYVDSNPGGETIWQYYFRQNPENGNLIVLGQWGYFHILMCEMSAHGN